MKYVKSKRKTSQSFKANAGGIINSPVYSHHVTVFVVVGLADFFWGKKKNYIYFIINPLKTIQNSPAVLILGVIILSVKHFRNISLYNAIKKRHPPNDHTVTHRLVRQLSNLHLLLMSFRLVLEPLKNTIGPCVKICFVKITVSKF